MGLLDEPDLGASKPMITFLKKKGRRRIENTDDLVERLSAKFPYAVVSVLDGDELAVMSIAKQVQIHYLFFCLPLGACAQPCRICMLLTLAVFMMCQGAQKQQSSLQTV